MKRLGQFLVELGWIDKKGLARALQSQEVLGGSLGTCLLELELLTEERLLKALSHQVGVEAPRIQDLRNIPPQVYRLVPAKLAVRCNTVPFRMLGGDIYIAMSDVQNLVFQDEISFATGKSVRPYVAHEARIFEALETCYGHKCPARYRELLAVLNAKAGLNGQPPSSPSQWDTLPATPGNVPVPAMAESESPPPAASPTPITFEELGANLADSPDSDEIGRLLLQYLGPTLESVALFRVKRDEVVGWMGSGPGLDQKRLREFRLDFSQPSVFLNLRQGGLFYTGPLPTMMAHRQLAGCWGGELPEQCVVLPVRVQERLVTVIFCDPGEEGIAGMNLDQMQHLTAKTADALGHCILRNKHRQT